MHDFAARRERLRKNLNLNARDVFLVTNLINVSYLTGFTGSSGWLLIHRDGERLLSDTRYATQLTDECPGLQCDIRNAGETQFAALARVIKSAKFSSLKYEAESLTKATFDQLMSELVGVDLIGSTKEIENLRAIKDATEIAAIRDSIRVNQIAFQTIVKNLRADQTELQIAHDLEHEMRRLGASGVAFDPSVAAGPRSALPHGKPSHEINGNHSFFLIDWGARVRRYASDLTRILVTGKIPPKIEEIYAIVLTAQQAAINAIRPGAELKTIDAAARLVIENAGYGTQFGHGTGHGFGLEIHETPFLSPIHNGKLSPGMVITIEPGIYLPGIGGVRIEDDVLVTADGFEVLSNLPTELEQCVVEI